MCLTPKIELLYNVIKAIYAHSKCENDEFFKSVTFSNVRSLNYSPPPFSNQTSKYKIKSLY